METRRLFVALAAAFAAYLIYTVVYNRLVPPPPPGESPLPAATQPSGPAVPPAIAGAPLPSGIPTTAQAGPPAASAFTAAAEVETFALGGGPDDKLGIDLTSHGAAVTSIKLTERKKDGQYVHRQDAETNEPYVLLKPVDGPDGPFASYVTRKVLLGKQEWPLDELIWELGEKGDRSATFVTTLQSAEGEVDLLRVTKTYALEPGSAVMHLRLKVENLGAEPFKFSLEQNGSVGVVKENLQYDMRKLVRARWDEVEVDPKAFSRGDLESGKPLGSSQEQFLWTSLQNKYFAVFTRPLPPEGAALDYVERVVGNLVIPNLANGAPDPGDYLARIITTPQEVTPGGATEYVFEVYAGTKNEDDLKDANPAYADRTKIGYVAARDADQRCCICNLPFLTSFMTGLLEMIQVVVRNYGVAIIVLVLMIRVLLHPLAVFQQKSMYRMQEAMAQIKPKLDALKEKYPNDRVKYNQEQMKVYAEEGINPMANLVGMLPLMIQMPILIAMWTALNTDVHLRHAGLDPWWITDLSAPDAFIKFEGDGITFPILSMLPLIGGMFTNIQSLNLLPILMGVSMWLQQKYMPKPGMQAKLEAAKKAAQEKSPQKRSGTSPEDQARQQQMIMYMMSFIFPIMLYRMPSGLNLYWMSTNVFGILESLRIRQQIKKEKERHEREGPRPVAGKKKPGVAGRILKHLAARAEGLQKRADTLSQAEAKRGAKKDHHPSKR